MSTPEQGARGTVANRFQVRRQLGAGGMGVVYEVFDTERQRSIAMKVMRTGDAAALYRFKKEFRALADLHHPHLISLYELVSTEDNWFFTMELIEGVSFRDYVRPPDEAKASSLPPAPPRLAEPQGGSGDDDTDVTKSLPELQTPAPGQLYGNTVSGADGSLDETRLRAALRQLAAGIAALHGAGKLHRDIKPSNVLVTHEGRVVLCDFGLVKEMPRADRTQSADHAVAGTIAYMSPEQADGEPLTEASDWYSVGVMLYEALVGRVPFSGTAAQVLTDKRSRRPRPPGELAPDLPRDLSELCEQLLEVEPVDRPDGASVMARLSGSTEPPIVDVAPQPTPLHFIGRASELAILREAFRKMAGERALTIFVHGESGMGKSALLEEIVAELRAERRTLVVTGRCYERESVRFKVFDSVVDGLTTHLLKLPAKEIRALVPRDVVALCRVFPVLRRVTAFDEAAVLALDAPDPQESRRRAFAALRELLARIGRTRELVLCIDDVQWGDVDSLPLVMELLRPPDAPAMLLLLCFRREEAEASPLLRSLAEQRGTSSMGEVLDLPIDALPADEARALAVASLRDPAVAARHAETIARESGGNPLFIRELSRYALSGAELQARPGGGLDVKLERVLALRIDELPERARRLLEVIAVAGHPVQVRVAAVAAGEEEDLAGALTELRHAHLVRSVSAGVDPRVETYHDRVRQVVVDSLESKVLHACHEALARAYEARGGEDALLLVEHWRGAGRHREASEHAATAAVQAAEALAFDRAAHLFRLALELGSFGKAKRATLRAALAGALANAGRGAEAAEAYVAAAEGAKPSAALELRRRAAEQWLHTGHFDRGLEEVKEVLRAIGLELAPSPKRALLSLLRGRMWLALRGLRYRERDTDQVAREALTRIDILRAVATGLSLIEPIRAADFNTRHLLAALKVGEPYRVARALAVESAHSATGGGKTQRRTIRLAQAAMTLAERIGDPHAIGLATTVSGLGAFLRGEWREARDRCGAAEKILRDRTTGTTWELTSAQAFMLAAMFYLGELSALTRLVPERLHEAEERGNLWFATGLRSWRTNTAWLALDDPNEARRQVDLANRQWSREGFHLQHYYELLAHGQIDLYVGNGREGLERVNGRWRDLSRSLLLRVQNVRVEACHLRARCALMAAEEGRDPILIRQARDDARRIAKEHMPWADGLAALIGAAADALSGDVERARASLEHAESVFSAADMELYAAACRARRGALTPASEGAELVDRSLEEIARMGARNPARLVGMLAPGFGA